ncbi:MAG: YjjG family noncanonical pyrimidine nucleotidase [Bacteroidales bacterium]|nr:YjjG family noncanonical pyrimidine nucleotidase [Bacteroidales bacterium]
MYQLLFDLDRTLWDFDGNADCTYRAMFGQFGIGQLCHVDYDTFHDRYKQINDVLWEAYRNGTVTKEQLSLRRFSLTLGSFGCNHESPEIIKLSLQMADYYVEQGVRQTRLMPGARNLLEWLGERCNQFSLSVITNGFSEAQLPKMRTSGIDRYFSHFFLSEDLGFMKPDRRFFEAVLQKLAVPPKQCLVIGDDYKVDIAGAMSVGIPQVWYNPRSLPLAAGDTPPTYEITDLSECVNLFMR